MKIKIFGREYNVGDNLPPDHMREVARYLNNKMEEISKEISNRSYSDIAVLAALNITDDLLEERKLKAEAEAKLKKLLSQLEGVS